MLGLGLDNCGWTTENAYRRIYSQWIVVPIKWTVQSGDALELDTVFKPGLEIVKF